VTTTITTITIAFTFIVTTAMTIKIALTQTKSEIPKQILCSVSNA
jgi:hypothetical protein